MKLGFPSSDETLSNIERNLPTHVNCPLHSCSKLCHVVAGRGLNKHSSECMTILKTYTTRQNMSVRISIYKNQITLQITPCWLTLWKLNNLYYMSKWILLIAECDCTFSRKKLEWILYVTGQKIIVLDCILFYMFSNFSVSKRTKGHFLHLRWRT